MSLKTRVAKLEARQPRGVLAFLNMLDPRYDGMTVEEAKRAAGYDKLGPDDTLYVFFSPREAVEREDHRSAQDECRPDMLGQGCLDRP